MDRHPPKKSPLKYKQVNHKIRMKRYLEMKFGSEVVQPAADQVKYVGSRFFFLSLLFVSFTFKEMVISIIR